MMPEFEYFGAEMIESAINVLENAIERLNVGEAKSALIKLKELINELINSNKTAQQQSRKSLEENAKKIRTLEEENEILKENEDDHLKRVARHERDIFRLDDEVKQLRETVTKHEDRIEKLQDEVKDLRHNQEQTHNELSELRETVHELQNIIQKR